MNSVNTTKYKVPDGNLTIGQEYGVGKVVSIQEVRGDVFIIVCPTQGELRCNDCPMLGTCELTGISHERE